jgi:hypothetical protein
MMLGDEEWKTLYLLSYKAKLGMMLFFCDVNEMNEFLLFHAWCQVLIQRMLYMIFPWDSTRDVIV